MSVRLLPVLAVLLAGCLPSSGKRQDTALLPADSTSRVLAQAAPVDTLARVWRAEAPADDPFVLPTSIAWTGGAAGARLAVADTPAGRIRFLEGDGAFGASVALGAETYPYAAGARGDTLGVLLRGPEALALVVGETVVQRVPAPGASAAVLTTRGAVVRLGGGRTGVAPELARLDTAGAVVARGAITGPAWRAAGFLTPWGDDVLALSGYRPVVDVWRGDRATLDTLALAGFDSPQLRRSAQFLRGDADEPPLLAPSARALGERLYVLNARADALRIDVYDRAGRLERVLMSPGPYGPLDLVAVDLALRETPDGLDVAVLWQRPRGLLRPAGAAVERWRIPPAVADRPAR